MLIETIVDLEQFNSVAVGSYALTKQGKQRHCVFKLLIVMYITIIKI